MIHTDEPTHQGSRRTLKVPLALTAAAVVTAGITATVFLTTSSNSDGTHPANGMFTAPNPLANTSRTCAAGTLGDNDQTLIVDMAGEEPGTGTATIEDVLCVLAELEAPQSVLAQMESTRALDGMQSATWPGYKTTWTYHPDDGLDLIITTT